MATDIAFALGVLALMGKRIPLGLKLFLTTLAIADDLGALLVIAIFYTKGLDMQALAAAGIVFAILLAMGFAGFRSLILYMLVGLVLWYFVFKSGIHATIAGVLLAMAIPMRPRVDAAKFVSFTREALDEFERGPMGGKGEKKPTTADQQELVHGIENAATVAGSPLHRLEYILGPWVGFLIIPVFALANSGVHIGAQAGETAGEGGAADATRVGLGVALGLVIGKPVGVFLFSWLAVKTGLGVLPTGVRWGHIHGVSWLAGIGFTMALFIGNLAFLGHPELLDGAKLGILGGSAVAAVVGLAVLLVVSRRPSAGAGEDH
jgi:NhaA family Na+:H+ antiporter